MAANSKIEWTNASWTPIRARNLVSGRIGWHCEHASDGCRFCYAEGMNKRFGTDFPFKPAHRKDIELFLDGEMLLAPLRWKKPRMIFVCSMTDLFADFVPYGWIDRVFAVMALCPQHVFQVLTKRSKRMRRWAADPATPNRVARAEVWPLVNVWLGVSAERQAEADERIPDLLATPAAVRFVSLEPLLGPIRLHEVLGDDWLASGLSGERRGLDWIIIGSESGPRARPCDVDWVRSLKDQCVAADVPFFWKQHINNGRKISTPELDGRTWTQFPRITA